MPLSERSLSIASEALFSSFFGKPENTMYRMPNVGSENDFMELLRKIPSTGNMAGMNTGTGTAAPISAFAGDSAAAPLQGDEGNGKSLDMHRCASLDVLRASIMRNRQQNQQQQQNEIFVKVEELMAQSAAPIAVPTESNGASDMSLPMASLLDPFYAATTTTIAPVPVVGTLSSSTAAAAAAATATAAIAALPALPADLSTINVMLPYLSAMNAAAVYQQYGNPNNINNNNNSTVPPPPPMVVHSVPTTTTSSAPPANYSSGGEPSSVLPHSPPTRAKKGRGGVGRGTAGSKKKEKGTATAEFIVIEGDERGHRAAGCSMSTGDEGAAEGGKAVDRRVRRMMSNRESARRSRKRKQEHLQELENTMAAVAAERGNLQAENAALRMEVESLRAQLMSMQQQNNNNKRYKL